MLKTNTKQAKENIKKYILENYNNTDYEDTNDWKEVKNIIRDTFYNEKHGDYYFVKYGEYFTFKDWCQGLPSVLDTCYYYNRSAIKDLGDILEETEEERNKFTEEQAEERLTYLIYREVFR